MRNIALNHTKAKYVFLSDVDFMPTFGLHKYLQKMIDQGALGLKGVSCSLYWRDELFMAQLLCID